MRIDYVEGNRDFFIGRGPYAELFDSVGDEVTVEIGGRRMLLVHGDGLNRKDRLYRLLALVLALPAGALRHVPPAAMAGSVGW